MSMQNLEYLCYEIRNFTFNSKSEQSLKQHCHPYKKKQVKIPSKNNVY